jgi:hypothetical protein
MARNLETTTGLNLALGAVRPAFFVKFDFTSGTTRWCTLPLPIALDDTTWATVVSGDAGSSDWIGLGMITAIEMPKETQDGSAQGLNFGLSGLPSGNVSLALSENYQNAPVTLWLATMSGPTTISGTPYQMFKGLVDVMELTDDGTTSSITIKTEGFAYGVGPSEQRRTEQDQKERHGNDRSLRFIGDIEDKEFLWGIK